MKIEGKSVFHFICKGRKLVRGLQSWFKMKYYIQNPIKKCNRYNVVLNNDYETTVHTVIKSWCFS